MNKRPLGKIAQDKINQHIKIEYVVRHQVDRQLLLGSALICEYINSEVWGEVTGKVISKINAYE